MKLGARDFVAIGALGAALLLGARLFLRSHELLGARWSDGEAEFSPRDDGLVRHAVWEPAETLAELGGGAGATLSPDGRWLVFAQGERGLNAELWRAERRGEGFGPAEPISELNSPADELAPCFGDGVLYFASDRPGGLGGLDLVRATYAEGAFGAVERLAPGLNSPADESDPACVPGTPALVFASNRARRARADFDLYRAEPDGTGFFAVDALDALNTEADERDPGLARDARSLWFASDRGGNFDLFRAWGDGTRWQRAEPLTTLNSPDEERGPWLAAGGFELLFEHRTAGAEPGIRRARSRELLTLPPSPVSLAEWITLALLALIGLLALLARRWHELDILWKCLLVSLLVHLLLLVGMRHVYPEHGALELGPRPGHSIRVRLAPEESDARPVLEARSGPAAPAPLERSAFTPARAASETPERLALAAPTTDEARVPERERATRTTAADARPAELQDREARAQRSASAAPSLALTTAASPERTSESVEVARHAATPALLPGRAPTSAELGTVAASELAAASAPERLAPAPESAPALASPALAGPAESYAREAAAAPELAFSAAATARAPAGTGAQLAREVLAPEGSARAEPSVAELSAPSGSEPGAAPRRAALAAGPADARPAPTAALRAPLAAPLPVANAARAFDALSGLEAGAAERAEPGAAPAPERGTFAAGPARQPAEPDALELAQAQGTGEAPSPERSALSSVSSPAAPAARELRGPRAEPSTRSEATRPGFDALAGLAAHGTPAPAASAPATRPEREAFRTDAEREAPATPAALGMAPVEASRASDEALPERARLAAEPGASPAGGSAAELRAPTAEPLPTPARTEAPAFDALAGLAAAETPRRAQEQRAPHRAALTDLAEPLPTAPAPAPTRALELPPPAALPAHERTPARSADTPYQNRFGAAKLRALEEFGGNEETEHAVAAGLAYLARIQNENGSWGQRGDRHEKYLDVRVGKSALALLAFLGAGHVPDGGTEHAALVERTLGYLLATQDRASGHFGQSCAYGHGITTYALAECFALTRDERLRAPLERAVAHIVANQHQERDPRFFGGWGYYFGDGRVWNDDEWPRTSVTAWQIMALESARLGGLQVDDAVFESARTFLVNTWDREQQAFRYSHDPARLSSGWPILPASTPASLFGLSLLGVDVAGEELAAARRFVLTRAPDGYRFSGDDDFVRRARGNPYFWYYGSLAMFRVGGREWEAWNRALQTTLLPSQDDDGSWRPLDPYAEYAGDEDDERTYTTAMCVLSLEVYYRYFTPLLRVK